MINDQGQFQIVYKKPVKHSSSSSGIADLCHYNYKQDVKKNMKKAADDIENNVKSKL